MNDNKDEEKTLFQAIDAVDDKFLMETLKDMEKRKNKNHKQQLKFKQMTPMVKAATIALICFLTLGISVSVAAATSKTFRQWIQKTFMSQTIYKVTQNKDVSDHKKNQKIVLKDNMETKQPGISGYAHNKEICFIGKDKIVAMGNPVMTKNSEYNVWNKINLKTAKATKQWDDRSKEEQYSNNEWYVYKEKKGKLYLKHLAYETSIDIPDVKTVHIIDDAGDYVLFDDDQGNDYLCNLRNKTYKKFILPKKFRDDTQMYLAGKEKKMLVQHGKEIYLIDISDMYKNIQPRK